MKQEKREEEKKMIQEKIKKFEGYILYVKQFPNGNSELENSELYKNLINDYTDELTSLENELKELNSTKNELEELNSTKK